MPSFVTVARRAAVPPGGALRVEVNETVISLWDLNGTLYAIHDICTHEEEYLSEGVIVDGCCVECPLHGAIFDLATGAARALPATTPVRTYPVRVIGEDVQIEI